MARVIMEIKGEKAKSFIDVNEVQLATFEGRKMTFLFKDGTHFISECSSKEENDKAAKYYEEVLRSLCLSECHKDSE